MVLVHRPFLWVALFGFLFSFHAVASSSEEADLEMGVVRGSGAVPENVWLQIHADNLRDLRVEYSRAKGTGRFFDVSADVLKVIGYTGVGATTALAYLETALGGGYWALAAGLTGSVSGAFLVLAEKADGGSTGKFGEIKEISSCIEALEYRRRLAGEDPHEEDISIEISHSSD
ncbi:MAG: hypothetical protein GY915_02085 [bacterium]|nr:hypothetical protein [bacterium]